LRPDALIGGRVKMHIAEKAGDNGPMVIWTPTPHRGKGRQPTLREERETQYDRDGNELAAVGTSGRRDGDPFD